MSRFNAPDAVLCLTLMKRERASVRINLKDLWSPLENEEDVQDGNRSMLEPGHKPAHWIINQAVWFHSVSLQRPETLFLLQLIRTDPSAMFSHRYSRLSGLSSSIRDQN